MTSQVHASQVPEHTPVYELSGPTGEPAQSNNPRQSICPTTLYAISVPISRLKVPSPGNTKLPLRAGVAASNVAHEEGSIDGGDKS